MNYRNLLFLGIALLTWQSATAEMRVITLASEVALSEFRVPASPNGVASFKTCPECELQVVSVTQNTRYELNNQSVTLQDFRMSLSTVLDRDAATVIVMHHLESDLITLIAINL